MREQRATPARRAPSRSRKPLTRQRVLRAAMRLADSRGVDAITMRRLGQALGVEAMSLYNHVANKEDVLNGIADAVVGQIELPDGQDDWETALRRMAVSAHAVLRHHVWACSLIMSPARDLPSRIDYMEATLACLRNAGFSPQTTYHAYHAIDAHILGFTMWEAGHSTGTTELNDLTDAFVREYGVRYPFIAEHAGQHVDDPRPGKVNGFEFGLDLILDGLRRLRARGD